MPKEDMTRRATREDVAKLAGVSTATVSRVINTPDKVSEKLRLRVLEAIKEINHTPNVFARGLKTGKSYQITLLVSNILNPFYSEVAAGVEAVARDKGYFVSVINLRGNGDYMVDSILARHIDGVVLMTRGISREGVVRLAKNDVPIVTAFTHFGISGVKEVSISIEQGMEEALNHLVALGHKNIGYLSVVDPYSEYHLLEVRMLAYKNFMERLGIMDWQRMVAVAQGMYSNGYNGIKELLEKTPDITAVVCYNDVMALGAYKRLCEMGIKVPQELSLVGYDNIFVAATTGPGLTTVDMPKYELGKKCATNLFDYIDKQEFSDNSSLETYLVIRNSTDKVC